MPEKENSKIKFLEEATKFGSLIYLIREGWLRKRWRERFCVLKDDIIYLFENKIKDDSDKPVFTIQLKKYEEAVTADKKDCKKGLATFLIQPKKSENKKSDVKRALFASSDSDLVEDWKNQINKTIKGEKVVGPTLKHLTKTRPKPQNEARGRSRRPPSRAHLRNKALTSSVGLLLDQPIEEEVTSEKKKRGKIPTTALKPKIHKKEEDQEIKGQEIKEQEIKEQEKGPDAEKDPQNTSKGETPSGGEKVARSPPPLPDSSKKPKLIKEEDQEEDVERYDPEPEEGSDEKGSDKKGSVKKGSDKKGSDEEGSYEEGSYEEGGDEEEGEEGGAFTDDELDEVDEGLSEGNLNNCNRVSLGEDQLKEAQKEDQLEEDQDQLDKDQSDKDQLDEDQLEEDQLKEDEDLLEDKEESLKEPLDEESQKDLLKKDEDQRCVDEDLTDSSIEDQLEESYNDLPNDVQDVLDLLEASADISSASSSRSTEDEDDKDLKKLETEQQVAS